MAYAYSDLLSQAQQWAELAYDKGQISSDDLALIEHLDQPQNQPLFVNAGSESTPPPLIVAFMGGTGVGKSSLLNRLAGQPIAKAGVVRPTSREVTLYHHHGLLPSALPAGLPLDSIQIRQHYDDNKRRIVWIDMPDFDSVEISNRRLVLEWLPHIDVLLYVVSPERYRDQKAWQLLLAEGAKHAWLFVMNQWDRGQPEQYLDLQRQLNRAGFDAPLIFRTSCSEPVGDQFDELLAQIITFSEQPITNQLRHHGEVWRLAQLQICLHQVRQSMNAQEHQLLTLYLVQNWPALTNELEAGLAWNMRQMAKQAAERLGQPGEACKLWDDWAQNRFNDLLDQLLLQANQASIAAKPLRAALQPLRQQVAADVDKSSDFACRRALLTPGNPAQRLLIKLMEVAETVLPLTAITVVGYQVFVGYYHSTADSTAYLGGDFAIHSVLLIGISWLIPFFLHKKLQPSLEKAALRGLQNGFQLALEQLRLMIEQQLANEREAHQQQLAELELLIQNCQPQLDLQQPDQSLSRALPATGTLII